MERRPIKTIRNQVYQILKDDICEGRFAPGQWLQENELAERLCVSRSPIREALRQLASDGLVVEIPNKGVFVKEFTARDIEEIFDLRVLLEDYAISKLQHHLTTADMQQLIDCLNEMERLHAQKNLRAYTDMDSKLHGLLIELCGGEAGPIVDVTHEASLPKRATITLRRSKLDRLIGHHIADEQVTDILRRLGCEVTEGKDEWQAVAPSWRFDMEIEEDLVNRIFAKFCMGK